MTALIIIGSILLLLAILLLAPIRLRVTVSTHHWSGSVGYLFVHMRFSPDKLDKWTQPKEKKEKKDKKAEETETKPEEEKEKKFGDTLDLVLSLLRSSKKALNRIRKGLVIYHLRIEMAVAKGDASDTALSYAKISGAVPILLSVLDELFTIKKPYVRIEPDFTGEHNRYNIQFALRIAPLVLIQAAVAIGLALFKALSSDKESKLQPNNKRKGGQVHESATYH